MLPRGRRAPRDRPDGHAMSQVQSGVLPRSDVEQRRARVALLVEQIVERRLGGEKVSDSDILRDHADLMPELGEQLRILRMVEQARDESSGAAQVRSLATVATSGARGRSGGDGALPQFDGYAVLREVSRGGQGVVYEALQDGTKRRVAIKVLTGSREGADAAQRRFEREIELVAQLAHPHIISIFHAGRTTLGVNYYVMDFVSGRPLRAFVHERALPIDEALRLFVKICDAVQFAHQRGVIHRDLKPSNILVDEKGEPRVLDFGLARSLLPDEQTTLTLSDQVLGTLPYMSPEQARGHAARVDTRTDVYSLGVVLYEMLTGTFPYPVTGTLFDVLKNISETPPAPPTQQWRSSSGVVGRAHRGSPELRCPIGADLQTIVLKALAKEPERRYQSAGELARDVERFVNGEPIAARRDNLAYVLSKLARRHLGATVALAAVLLILLGNAGVSLFFYRDAMRAWERGDAKDAVIGERNATMQGSAAAVQQGVFALCLAEWRERRAESALALRDRLMLGGVEWRCADFLLDSRADPEQFMRQVPKGSESLAWLVRAEKLRADGDIPGSSAAYEMVLESRPADWVRALADARLREVPRP